MKRYLGKILFPRLPRDQRDRRMNELTIGLGIGLVIALGIGLAIWLTRNK